MIIVQSYNIVCRKIHVGSFRNKKVERNLINLMLYVHYVFADKLPTLAKKTYSLNIILRIFKCLLTSDTFLFQQNLLAVTLFYYIQECTI